MLVGAGRASTRFLQASSPPADAPMATTRNAPNELPTSQIGNDKLSLAAGCPAAGLCREISDITFGSKGASDRRQQRCSRCLRANIRERSYCLSGRTRFQLHACCEALVHLILGCLAHQVCIGKAESMATSGNMPTQTTEPTLECVSTVASRECSCELQTHWHRRP
jgi:hypothetical protein